MLGLSPQGHNDNLIPDLQKLFRNRNFCIAIGDFNAKHSTWNRGRTDGSGTKIFNVSQASGYDLITPNEPTRVPQRINERPSTIDFGITKNISNSSVKSKTTFLAIIFLSFFNSISITTPNQKIVISSSPGGKNFKTY
ncbi:hypothetical protein NPIL_559011 [Nephila pilipes]|uniref:Endonuclease/exonuclease/phosphatase domain-containing protein n=1 Tax=Nephila pilipes TaxID=299642 RepID=A0A8X6NA60_NEPPI|nr:hypothetical protein NPIL_559011 [Nephila pilipes]